MKKRLSSMENDFFLKLREQSSNSWETNIKQEGSNKYKR